MHRPAPSDLETYFGPALAEAPQLLAPLERIKRKFEEGDMEGARPLLTELERAVEESEIGNGARKAARRGLNELGDSLGQDAYWRQRTWKKVLVIFAGPGTNLLFAIIVFAGLYVIGSGGYRLGFGVDADAPVVSSLTPAIRRKPSALEVGDRIVSINGEPVSSITDVRSQIDKSGGDPVTVVVRR